jgi:hypothetical protein
VTLFRPLWMQPVGGDPSIDYSGLDDRLLISSLWETEGVVWGLDVTQRAAGANFSVDVASGQCIITGNDVTLQGSYLCFSSATENIAVPTPPASGTRTHHLVAWVKDKLYDGTQTTYEWVLAVLPDVGGGLVAAPPSAISLAWISVSAGQASVTGANITPTAIHALTRPSRARLVASSAARPAVPLEAEEIWRTDLKTKEIYDGSAWWEIPRIGGGGSGWTSYTPTWTVSSGTAPSIGNGTRVGRYQRIGRTVHFVAAIVGGSTTNWGGPGGTYKIGLPVTARTGEPGQMCKVRISGGGDSWDGQGFLGANDSGTLTVNDGTDGSVTSFTSVSLTGGFVAGDAFRVWGTYEAAT